jgi:hypothetical protein
MFMTFYATDGQSSETGRAGRFGYYPIILVNQFNQFKWLNLGGG